MSTFFENQIAAKKRTKVLVFLYAMAVVCIIAAIYFVSLYFFAYKSNGVTFWHPDILLKVSLIVIAIIILASIYKIKQLGGGGATVASLLGGTKISPATTNPKERQLLNIVEEMAIASGLKVPPVYLMDNQLSINAFAAGTNPGNAVIGISRGSVELLSRDELQGVVAHEFSHILNGDMVINLRLIGVLSGILFIALVGRVLMRAGGRSSRSDNKNSGGGSIALFGLALSVIGYIGVFFATLIKMAISRQREYLADASAVQFTRHPDGIAGALKKIAALNIGSRIGDPHAEEISHMFFADGIKRSFSTLFSTHPPILTRIRAVDPYFQGVIPQKSYQQMLAESSAKTKKRPDVAKVDPVSGTIDGLTKNPINTILGSVGTVGLAHMDNASKFLNQLPPKIYSSAHEALDATLLVYLILLDEKEEVRKKQITLLHQRLPESYLAEFNRLRLLAGQIQDKNSLAILDLCLPALADLSEEQYRDMRKLAFDLAHADNKIDLYEYTLQIVLLKHFDRIFYPEKVARIEQKSLEQLIQPASDLFLGLAVLGNNFNLELAEPAYIVAAEHATIPEHARYDFKNLPEVDLKLLDHAIQHFTNVDYNVRQIILKSAIACITQDKTLNSNELALIRAIADSFDCPVPFFE